MTQEELAERAGVSVRGLRKLEAGEIGRPRPRTIRAIGVALGVRQTEWDTFRTGERPSFRWPRPRQLPAEHPAAVPGPDGLAAIDAVLAPGPRIGAAVVVVGGPPPAATALVLRWAHRAAPHYPDGQLFGRLRGAAGERRPPGVVLRGFLRALGVPAEEIPGSLEDAAALYRSLVCERRLLVALIDAVDADEATPLLPGGPGPAVLITGPERPGPLAAALGAAVVTARPWPTGQHRP
jgi:hypothetical protein